VRRRSLLAGPLFALPQFAQPNAVTPPSAPVRVAYRRPPPFEAYRALLGEGKGRMPAPAERHRDAWFADVTGSVLQSEQLSRGTPYWTARLDPATGIDVYGNQGIAVGDVDGDGRDEIYVCQPGGLPNKLFRCDGARLVDIGEQAGLHVLDDTVCALFLDVRNLGRQDLILMRSGGPVLFLNDGKGRFTPAAEAFRFVTAPAGSFTGMAAADFDRDGRLDVYCCTYSFFQSEAQYRYPSPYHDARNGPPNYLFRNRLNADGTGHFEDVTAAVGLGVNNNRFSFAPAWCDYDDSGWPSLYVANDFGRNNLYRNRGGRFEDMAAEAGVEDIGPGMSAAWFDMNRDGRADLYVANMHTMEGQSAVREFASPELKEAYRRHTKGNSLYENRGGGKFEETGARRGVEMGRWAWGADAHDFDNDGQVEIAVACGMMTGGRGPDLSEFFWRRVVAHSPTRAGERSGKYEDGWNALNQFIREGYSWSGHERNVFYRREGEQFVDASAESGFDFAHDSRSFAVTDLDGDGCLDILLKNRLGPQLQVLQNRRGARRERIGFRLRGVQSNQDAVGARVRVDGQTKWVAAGSGYLAQNTKALYFGLGEAKVARRVEVRWPGGREQEFTELAAGKLYRLVEGGAAEVEREFAAAAPWEARPHAADNAARLHDTWLVEPIPLPVRHAGPGVLVLEAAALEKNPDLLAAWSLFRRYLFEYRAELALPLALLLDGAGRAVKVYAAIPSPEQAARDLRAQPAPLPYAGLALQRARRDFFKLGAALLSCGYSEEALPYLEAVLARDAGNVRTLVLVGQVHREAGRLAQAQRYLDEAVSRDAAAAEAWNELGGVALAKTDERRALECFERAMALQPDLVYARLNAAQTLGRLGRHGEAAAQYERVVAMENGNAEAHNGWGLALARQGESPKAEERFRVAIRLAPKLGSAWNNLGVLLLQGKREEEAVAVLREGIGASPAEEILYLNLARIHVGRKETAEARRVVEELLRQVPGSEVGRRALRQLGGN
jgi:tetratricopeptide (TPR) repeat protein